MSVLSFMEKLLSGVDVEWKAIGEVGEINGGLTGKSKQDFDNGNAKYVSYKNIFDNPTVDMSRLHLVRVSPFENQHEVKYGDVLFTGSSETADEAGMSSAITTQFDEPVYLNSFSFGLRFNERIPLIPEYSRHLFRSRFMRAAIAQTASGVTRFNISKARFRKILIPIPGPEDTTRSLEIQREVVRILDAFTDLAAELAVELAARQKQYEYYRELLFSFPKPEVVGK